MECPSCGNEVPEVEEKYGRCTKCGMNVQMPKKPPWWERGSEPTA